MEQFPAGDRRKAIYKRFCAKALAARIRFEPRSPISASGDERDTGYYYDDVEDFFDSLDESTTSQLNLSPYEKGSINSQALKSDTHELRAGISNEPAKLEVCSKPASSDQSECPIMKASASNPQRFTHQETRSFKSPTATVQPAASPGCFIHWARDTTTSSPRLCFGFDGSTEKVPLFDNSAPKIKPGDYPYLAEDERKWTPTSGAFSPSKSVVTFTGLSDCSFSPLQPRTPAMDGMLSELVDGAADFFKFPSALCPSVGKEFDMIEETRVRAQCQLALTMPEARMFTDDTPSEHNYMDTPSPGLFATPKSESTVIDLTSPTYESKEVARVSPRRSSPRVTPKSSSRSILRPSSRKAKSLAKVERVYSDLPQTGSVARESPQPAEGSGHDKTAAIISEILRPKSANRLLKSTGGLDEFTTPKVISINEPPSPFSKGYPTPSRQSPEFTDRLLGNFKGRKRTGSPNLLEELQLPPFDLPMPPPDNPENRAKRRRKIDRLYGDDPLHPSDDEEEASDHEAVVIFSPITPTPSLQEKKKKTPPGKLGLLSIIIPPLPGQSGQKPIPTPAHSLLTADSDNDTSYGLKTGEALVYGSLSAGFYPTHTIPLTGGSAPMTGISIPVSDNSGLSTGNSIQVSDSSGPSTGSGLSTGSSLQITGVDGEKSNGWPNQMVNRVIIEITDESGPSIGTSTETGNERFSELE